MSERLRGTAREIFLEALAVCRVGAAVQRMLAAPGNVLRVDGRAYDLAAFAEMRIVAMGKAGATLYDAVRPLLGARRVHAVVSTPVRPGTLGDEGSYFAGGHPLPNEDSLAAGRAAMELLRGASEQTLVLFLVSGGASAMFEAPLVEGISLRDLLELNRLLIGSGAPIAEMNCVRKHLSAVKGGRLLRMVGKATCLSLMVSDVPAGKLDALGSGPTLPDATTVEECLAVVNRWLGGAAALPESVRRLLVHGLPETPKGGEAAFSRAQAVVLLDNARLVEAAREAADRRGFAVTVDCGCDDWDYREAAEYLLARLGELKRKGKPVCLISGGEVTVKLPAAPGMGGRNSQWVLACADRLQRLGSTVLSAGSDGVDGTSPAAGAVADETTWERAQAAGFDPERTLAEFDAYPLFSGIGDAVLTGATGNNLRDLRILLWDPEAC